MKNLISLGLICSALFACGDQMPGQPKFSEQAALEIESLNLNVDAAKWSSIKVVIKDEANNKTVLEKQFMDKAQEGLSLTLSYGRFRFMLTYLDAKGKAIYESCEADAKFVHQVGIPLYTPTINICEIKPGGSAGGSSSVIVNPVLKPTPLPAQTELEKAASELSFTWGACFPDKGPAGYGSVFKTIAVDMKTQSFTKNQKAFKRRDCTLAAGETKLDLKNESGKASTAVRGDETIYVNVGKSGQSDEFFIVRLKGEQMEILAQSTSSL